VKYLSAKTSPDLGTTANNSLGSLLFNLLKNNNQTKRSPQIIIWGYIVIVVLFSLILVTSIVQNKRTNDHVSEIVQQYGMKKLSNI